MDRRERACHALKNRAVPARIASETRADDLFLRQHLVRKCVKNAMKRSFSERAVTARDQIDRTSEKLHVIGTVVQLLKERLKHGEVYGVRGCTDDSPPDGGEMPASPIRRADKFSPYLSRHPNT